MEFGMKRESMVKNRLYNYRQRTRKIRHEPSSNNKAPGTRFFFFFIFFFLFFQEIRCTCQNVFAQLERNTRQTTRVGKKFNRRFVFFGREMLFTRNSGTEWRSRYIYIYNFVAGNGARMSRRNVNKFYNYEDKFADIRRFCECDRGLI